MENAILVHKEERKDDVRMNTLESLKADLVRLGIKPTDTVTIHSSMKKIGQTEGGGDTVIDAFFDYLGKDGLFVMPSHSWGTVQYYGDIYDPKRVASCLGLLPNLMLARENVHRSLHPTHSVCAFGKDAESFVEGELGKTDFVPRGGCYHKLLERGGKVMLIGVTQHSNTFFHGLETWETEGKPCWYRDEPVHYKIKVPGGEYVDGHVYHTTFDTSKYFEKMDEVVLSHPSTVVGKFGEADTVVMDCGAIYPIVARIFRENPRIFLEP